ncbi:MAG: aminopeptidase, partial [Bacteroidales bacterium]|nr:aminopeptidase [Bacteroidales bacterium]
MRHSTKVILVAALLAGAASVSALAQDPKGGLGEKELREISAGYWDTPGDKAIKNALATTSIATLAVNSDNAAMMDTHFSDRVKTKGITDQKSSGRCWLFTGLNVLRAKMI